jgi:hypothetical protein
MQDNFHRPDNHEAKMARADLFKCAQYSFKLFKMIREDQELEGWVQAKITKAADYIASVYHYMEYEMKISEYGSAIENSDMYSESIRRAFTQKLTEAKKQAVKAKDAMKKKEEDLDEGWADMLNANKARSDAEGGMKVGDKKKSSSHGVITKTEKGVVHKAGKKGYGNNWDGETPAAPSKAAKSASEKKSDKEKDIKLPAWKGNVTKHSSNKGAEKDDGTGDIKEGKKPDFLDMDKDGDKKEPMKKAVADKKAGPKKGVNPFAKTNESSYVNGKKEDPKSLRWKQTSLSYDAAVAKYGKENVRKEGKNRAGDETIAVHVPLGESSGKCNHTAKGKSCPVHGLKECSGSAMPMEASKPSAGMSAGAKSALVKKAKSGADIGNPGKSFDKVAAKAGGGEKGKKIAAAAMWKNAAK